MTETEEALEPTAPTPPYERSPSLLPDVPCVCHGEPLVAVRDALGYCWHLHADELVGNEVTHG